MKEFKLNEKYHEYEAIINGLTVKIPLAYMNENTALFAQQVCESYPQKLSELATFCLSDELFTTFYESFSHQDFLAKLGNPIIKIYAHGGKLTYLEHQFDEDHIVDIEFEGALEAFTEVVVDG